MKTHTIKINEDTSHFKPKIVRFKNSTSICGYLNFPYNYAQFVLPKKMHNKKIEILNFNNNEINLMYASKNQSH